MMGGWVIEGWVFGGWVIGGCVFGGWVIRGYVLEGWVIGGQEGILNLYSQLAPGTMAFQMTNTDPLLYC